MDTLRRQMEVDMLLGNYAENSRKIYLDAIRKFQDHFGRPAQEAGMEDIRAYLHHLIVDRDLSQSYIKQAYSALKILTERTLGKTWDVKRIPRARKQRKLPEVLSQKEVDQIFAKTSNLKYLALFTTMYSAGLRTGEVAKLRVSDIDSQRMAIRVEQGKGRKDRYTILAERTLPLLRRYWKVYRPETYLFTGASPDQPLSNRSIQRFFKETLKKTTIRKDVPVGTFRHSFATHLLDGGTDLYFIKELLGHANINTTTIYLRISGKRLSQVKSPFDLWPTEGR